MGQYELLISKSLLKVIIGSFLQNSLRTKTAEYLLISLDLELLSDESQLMAYSRAFSTFSAVIDPPALAKFPKHSAAFSTSSGLLILSCLIIMGIILLT